MPFGLSLCIIGFPEPLRSVLENPRIIKTGVAIQGERTNIRCTSFLNVLQMILDIFGQIGA